ncbi:hypothetical protein LEG80045_23310 [Legionella pneumophila]|nr:hypothetical protein LEG80045_23310 [Legionella pneumophila]VEB31294.1 Uncharacterised protein [Legionella pneumophila]
MALEILKITECVLRCSADDYSCPLKWERAAFYLSTLRLHDFFELSENYRSHLILLVGPLGLEPRTNGL